jgi:hypothetical protein
MEENRTFRSVSAGSNGNAAVKRTEAPAPQGSPKVLEDVELVPSEGLESLPPTKEILTQKEE